MMKQEEAFNQNDTYLLIHRLGGMGTVKLIPFKINTIKEWNELYISGFESLYIECTNLKPKYPRDAYGITIPQEDDTPFTFTDFQFFSLEVMVNQKKLDDFERTKFFIVNNEQFIIKLTDKTTLHKTIRRLYSEYSDNFNFLYEYRKEMKDTFNLFKMTPFMTEYMDAMDKLKKLDIKPWQQ